MDRTSPLPLWAQMQEDLRRRLTTGAFAERFPTELELVDSTRSPGIPCARRCAGCAIPVCLIPPAAAVPGLPSSNLLSSHWNSLYSLFQEAGYQARRAA
ncbi:MAG: hypothetical protein WBV74_13925 [Pseudonocardiaceae bacterium]